MTKNGNNALAELEKQVLSVVEGIKRNPDKRRQILMAYITHIYEAVKETIRKTGTAVPHYVIVSNTPEFGAPPVTDEILAKAKAQNAEAVVSVEGFESREDMADVIYHISMSAPILGAVGWVVKIKLEDKAPRILVEKPYLFEHDSSVKTLGELVAELDEEVIS